MTWEIALIFALLAAGLASFIWEKVPPDVTALGLLVLIIATGLLPASDAFSVFSNGAPLTVACMFVLSAALVKCGAIDRLSGFVEPAASLPYPVVIFLLAVVVGAASSFVNNTPVVVVFLPVVLNLARKMQIAPSKLLIPLSYSAVLGGTCTLIGTSTNLVVNAIAVGKGEPGLQMFELAWLGIPTAIMGMLYMAFFGKRLLPTREMLTSILSAEERREYITEAFVQPSSPMLNRTLVEAGLTKARGVRVLEIVRDGVAIDLTPTVRLEAGDRMILACRPKGIAHTRGIEGVDLVAEMNLELEQIAAHEGTLVEGVISPSSSIVGRTVREINFRQRFRMIVLAVHRRGQNLREQLDTVPLEGGDVLLMMGTDPAINAIRGGDDIILFEHSSLPARPHRNRMPLVLGTIVAVIVAASLDWVPIELGALTGCVFLCFTGCLQAKEAYRAIEWNVLFLIYGMLAVGLALERTGAASWVAQNVVSWVDHFFTSANKPFVMLACIYIVTALFTELLTNNAIAALMAPLAISLAHEMGLDPRPFIIAVTFAASAAFSTPIGYQTNTYVYGVGGYRFSDFVRFGIPMNILCFFVAMIVIPMIWSW